MFLPPHGTSYLLRSLELSLSLRWIVSVGNYFERVLLPRKESESEVCTYVVCCCCVCVTTISGQRRRLCSRLLKEEEEGVSFVRVLVRKKGENKPFKARKKRLWCWKTVRRFLTVYGCLLVTPVHVQDIHRALSTFAEEKSMTDSVRSSGNFSAWIVCERA